MSLLQQDLFTVVGKETDAAQKIVRPSLTYWQDVWRRFKQNKAALTGLLIIILLIIMAVVGPHLLPYAYSDQDFNVKNISPTAQHWFGTDDLGRDLFVRVWNGARISLFIGIVSAIIVFVLGVIYGGISGYFGGMVDEVMMRIIEILYAIPFLLYVILLMVIMTPGLKPIIISIGAVYWIPMARLVRGQVMSLKEQEYVLAAKTLGASSTRIISRHLIPNTLGPIIVLVTLAIPDAIFTEAWLSFLGLGVSAPIASWGSLASDGMEGLRSYPWQLFFPAFFISIAMLAFNLVGDGLRDALDPRQRN